MKNYDFFQKHTTVKLLFNAETMGQRAELFLRSFDEKNLAWSTTKEHRGQYIKNLWSLLASIEKYQK
jgi:hypothetical protein